MSNKLKALRELIIKSNPKHESRIIIPDNCGCRTVIFTPPEPITLAEVLISLKEIDETQSISIDTWGLIWNDEWDHQDNKSIKWDLTKDLDGQSPETIQKLLKLMEKHND